MFSQLSPCTLIELLHSLGGGRILTVLYDLAANKFGPVFVSLHHFDAPTPLPIFWVEIPEDLDSKLSTGKDWFEAIRHEYSHRFVIDMGDKCEPILLIGDNRFLDTSARLLIIDGEGFHRAPSGQTFSKLDQ